MCTWMHCLRHAGRRGARAPAASPPPSARSVLAACVRSLAARHPLSTAAAFGMMAQPTPSPASTSSPRWAVALAASPRGAALPLAVAASVPCSAAAARLVFAALRTLLLRPAFAANHSTCTHPAGPNAQVSKYGALGWLLGGMSVFGVVGFVAGASQPEKHVPWVSPSSSCFAATRCCRLTSAAAAPSRPCWKQLGVRL